jgi:hypothetical protein
MRCSHTHKTGNHPPENDNHQQNTGEHPPENNNHQQNTGEHPPSHRVSPDLAATPKACTHGS